jgi:hypothetical protein
MTPERAKAIAQTVRHSGLVRVVRYTLMTT